MTSCCVLQAMKEMLDQQYPPGLLNQLQAASQGAFDDAASAFPNQEHPRTRNLREMIACASPAWLVWLRCPVCILCALPLCTFSAAAASWLGACHRSCHILLRQARW